jgi:hypothetical protein
MNVLYIQHFDHLFTIDGHEGWFHPLAVVNDAALDSAMQLSVCTSANILTNSVQWNLGGT